MKILSCFLNLFKLPVLGLVAVALFSHEDANASTYDFFYFVQTWPGSYPKTPPSSVPDDRFAIHGLWPQLNNGADPKCPQPSAPFDPAKLRDIRNKLDKEWPTLEGGSTNELFWKHEWENHGGCSEDKLTLSNYFNANLLLKDKTQVFQTLKNRNVKPTGQLYSLAYIQESLTNKVGVTTLIQCNRDAKNTTYQLYEVYFCVDTAGANFQNCSSTAVKKFNAGCGGDKSSINFPVYKQRTLVLNGEESPFETSDI